MAAAKCSFLFVAPFGSTGLSFALSQYVQFVAKQFSIFNMRGGTLLYINYEYFKDVCGLNGALHARFARFEQRFRLAVANRALDESCWIDHVKHEYSSCCWCRG